MICPSASTTSWGSGETSEGRKDRVMGNAWRLFTSQYMGPFYIPIYGDFLQPNIWERNVYLFHEINYIASYKM